MASVFADRTHPAAPSLGLVLVIGAAIMLNYVDRGAISVAAPLIKDEMGLSATGYGLVVSSFYWTYVPVLMIAGWLADKVSVHRLMAAGVTIWALATLATGFAGGLVGLVILRLFMGLGEGVAFPCGSKLLARVPEARRSSANVTLSAGIALGPLVGTLVGGLILESLGWRPMFLIFGALTLLWLLPWWRFRGAVDGPVQPAMSAAVGVAVAPVSYPRLIANRQLWAMTFFHFTGTYALYFVLAWLPLWLVKVRGYSIGDMALLTGLFYLVQAASGLVVAWLCDRLIASGHAISGVRRGAGLLVLVLVAVGIVALGNAQGTFAIAFWLVVVAFGAGPTTMTLFTSGQTLAGPGSAGRWMGVQAGVGNLAGVIGPVVTGIIVDNAGYGPAFLLTAAIVVAGGVVFGFGVPRLTPIDW